MVVRRGNGSGKQVVAVPVSLMVCAAARLCPRGAEPDVGWCPLSDDVCGDAGMSTGWCLRQREGPHLRLPAPARDCAPCRRQPSPRLNWTVAPERPRHHREDHAARTRHTPKVNDRCAAERALSAYAATPLTPAGPPPSAARAPLTVSPPPDPGSLRLLGAPTRTAPQVQTRSAPPRTATLRAEQTKRPRTGTSTAGTRNEKKHRRRRQGTTTPRQRKDPHRRDDAPAAEPHLLAGFSASVSPVRLAPDLRR